MASNMRKGKIPYRTTGVGKYVDETFTLGGFFGDWAHLFRRHNLAHPVRFYDRGRWLVETELGALEVEPGDFVVLPKGLIYRETPLQSEGNVAWVFETASPVHLAESLWDSVGFVGMFIDYSEMEVPEPAGDDEGGETEVRVLVDGEEHFLTYDFDPCRDVIGWVGDPVVFKMSAWAVPAPGTSRGHLPPPAHAVLWSDDRSFFFNAMAFAPFPNKPAPDGSIGAPSH